MESIHKKIEEDYPLQNPLKLKRYLHDVTVLCHSSLVIARHMYM